MENDARTQRDRQADLLDTLDRLKGDKAPRVVAQLGRVYNAGSIPTSVLKYFAVHPVALAGAEAERGTFTQTPALAKDLVLVLGSNVPVAGDSLVYFQVGDRWVAQSGKTGAPPPPKKCLNCPTTDFPDMLHYTDSVNSQNGIPGIGYPAQVPTWDGVNTWTCYNHYYVAAGTICYIDGVDGDDNPICIPLTAGVNNVVAIVEYKLFCPDPDGNWTCSQGISYCLASGGMPFVNITAPGLGVVWDYNRATATANQACDAPISLTFSFTRFGYDIPTAIFTP